ncbi:hypothetical protein [Pseudomonas psychrophila]|uniref:Uncharacterized protein n=1 Tax=Pseudomonas psychrophila TaxID=122355 RepID=A0A8I1FVR6_9PSED|nr:hypothetical protein [Pseudomonas psychrophila]MBJ2259673.1 hypothetical protein [Pseudomonas psychrophila]
MDSLGRTTCLTGTDTVGANYNAAAGTASIVGVDSTAASVTAALNNISTGTLAGLTPGAALIANVAAAKAEIAALEKASFGTNPTFDGIANKGGVYVGLNAKDGKVTADEAIDAKLTAEEARTNVDIKTTAVLTEESTAAAAVLLNAKALVAASGTAAVTAQKAYDAAVAAQKVLVGSTAATAVKTAPVVAEEAAIAAAATAMTAVGSSLDAAGYVKLSTAFGSTIDSVATLKDALTSLDGTATKAALIAELQKLPTYGQAAIDAVAKETAIIAANVKVTTAEGGTGIADYVTAAKAAATAAELVTKATTADAAIAVAKVVVDKFAALDTKVTLATTELNTFKTANGDKIDIKDLTGNTATPVVATAKSDVFYFTKVAATDDFTVGGAAATNFGAGDNIVLGSGYVFNSGALTTGSASALEVFFVKTATGTQVVIETNAVGSATTATDTAGVVTGSNEAAVINLVGVTADHLSVANGVVSYV